MSTIFHPQPLPRPRIVLTLWGDCEAAVCQAEEHARHDGPGRYAWIVTDVRASFGIPCPIVRDDPTAIATGAGYGWAYAAHSAAASTEETP